MDKNEIVVGGVYQFNDPEFDMTYPVTVRYINDGKARVDLPYGVAYLYPHELGEQIGYDATYSEAYQALVAKRKTLQQVYEYIDRLHMETISILGVLDNGAYLSALVSLRSKFDNKWDKTNAEMKALQAQSWTKDTDHERH